MEETTGNQGLWSSTIKMSCAHTVKASTGSGGGSDPEYSRRSAERRNLLELDCRPDCRTR
jgi:hypothetical protein